MGRFKYRMQNVLDIKFKMEEQAKNEFAFANGKLIEEQEKLEACFRRKSDLEAEADGLLIADSLNVRDILQNRQGILKSRESIEAQDKQVKYAERLLEEKRKKLAEEMMERKTHEKLKENALEEFFEQEKAEEGKEIDQLTSYTYGKVKK